MCGNADGYWVSRQYSLENMVSCIATLLTGTTAGLGFTASANWKFFSPSRDDRNFTSYKQRATHTVVSRNGEVMTIEQQEVIATAMTTSTTPTSTTPMTEERKEQFREAAERRVAAKRIADFKAGLLDTAKQEIIKAENAGKGNYRAAGEALSRLEAQGVTQEEMAKHCERSQGYISKILGWFKDDCKEPTPALWAKKKYSSGNKSSDPEKSGTEPEGVKQSEHDDAADDDQEVAEPDTVIEAALATDESPAMASAITPADALAKVKAAFHYAFGATEEYWPLFDDEGRMEVLEDLQEGVEALQNDYDDADESPATAS
jgi:hypothetical protein